MFDKIKGLIYVHFGEEIINHLVNDQNPSVKIKFESEEERKHLVNILYDKLYENFVREIDAIDNGIDIADERRYEINTNLSARVGGLNPMWNDTDLNENVRKLFIIFNVSKKQLIKRQKYHLSIFLSLIYCSKFKLFK